MGHDWFENSPACCLVSFLVVCFCLCLLLAIISVEMNRSEELTEEGGVIGGDRAEGNKRGQAQIVAGD